MKIRFKKVLTIAILTLVILIGLSTTKSVYALTWDQFSGKFSDISFHDSNSHTYNQTNVGTTTSIYMKRFGTMTTTKWYFEPSHKMYCIQPGTSWNSNNIQIENLYAIYGGSLYAYDKVNDNSFLSSGTIPSDAKVGIGSNYGNLINQKYNQLAYALSQIGNSDYTIFEGDRYEHRLSPIQLAIWQMEKDSSLSDNTIVQKMFSGRNDYYNNVSNHQTVSEANLKQIFKQSKKLLAYSKAYKAYVGAGKVSATNNNTTITGEGYNIRTVNGKKIIGPFKIENFQGITQNTISYSYSYNGLSDSGSVTGKYGQITKLELAIKGITTSLVCDQNGNEKPIATITTEGNHTIYFDITEAQNATVEDEATITMKINNPYRYAYVYAITHTGTGSDYQEFILGEGKSGSSYQNSFQFQTTLERVTLSGKVWLDVEHGIKPIVAPNGIMDSDEEKIEGINVILYKDNNGTKSEVATTTTNAQGKYEFNDVIKNNGDKFYVIFEYDGMNYEATVGTGSSATEQQRTTFNQRFAEINPDLRIEHFFRVSNGVITEGNYTTPQSLSYRYEGNKAILKTKNSSNELYYMYRMYAMTGNYTSSNSNVNFGLKVRKPADLSITNEMSQVIKVGDTYNVTYKVNVNNQGATDMALDSIDYYLDAKYTVGTIKVKYRGNTTTLTAENGGTVTIGGKEYIKLTIASNLSDKTLQPGERLTIEVVGKTNNSSQRYYTFAEITGYKTPEGRVDKDSAPGDAISGTSIVHNSDDSDASDIYNII